MSLAVKKLSCLGWFDPLICSDDVSSGKPNPACFLKVAMTVAPATETLILKDSNI